MYAFIDRYKTLFVISFVLVADFISKYLVNEYLPLMSRYYHAYPYGGIGIFKNFLGIEFAITHLTNKGAAWGIFAEHQNILLVFRIFLIIAFAIYLLFFNVHKDWEMPLGLITAGALGNVIDYFVYGHVVDMFHFTFWGYNFAVFNIADSCVTIGIIWLFLLSTFESKKDLVI